MTSKEIVKRAVEMSGPPRVPFLFLNKDREKSDILMIGYGTAKDFKSEGTNKSEWGFEWQKLDDTMGQPKNPPITSWSMMKNYKVLDPCAPGRFDHIENLGCFNGGFIGYIEEYHSIGMSEENYKNIVEAFESLNR